MEKASTFVVALLITLTGVTLAIAGQYVLLTIRCSWCRGNLRSLVYRRSSVDHAKFCFHCARSLDDTPAVVSEPRVATVLDELV